MPSSTQKQARLMGAIAHGWKPTRMKNPPPLKVAQEYNRADTGTRRLKKAMRRKKFQIGGLASIGPMMQRLMSQRQMRPVGMADPRQRIQQGPSRMMGPRQMQQRPVGMADPRQGLPGPGMPPGLSGGLARSMQGRPGGRPGFRGEYPPRGPIRPAGGLNRPSAGRGRPGPVGPGPAPNALLSTSRDLLSRSDDQLNRMRSGLMNLSRRPMQYAGGGKVKRAIAALDTAREWLDFSDGPDTTQAIRNLRDVPGTEKLRRLIQGMEDAPTVTGHPDEFLPQWLEIGDEFDTLQGKLTTTPDFMTGVQRAAVRAVPDPHPQVKETFDEWSKDELLFADRTEYGIEDLMSSEGIDQSQAEQLQRMLHADDLDYDPF